MGPTVPSQSTSPQRWDEASGDVDLLAHGRAVAAVGVQAGVVAERD